LLVHCDPPEDSDVRKHPVSLRKWMAQLGRARNGSPLLTIPQREMQRCVRPEFTPRTAESSAALVDFEQRGHDDFPQLRRVDAEMTERFLSRGNQYMASAGSAREILLRDVELRREDLIVGEVDHHELGANLL